MKIIIVTQDDPFFLGKHLSYLFNDLPSWATVCGVIILDTSPFGKTLPFFEKIKKVYEIFRFVLFIKFSFRFINYRLFHRNFLVRNVIRKYNIKEIKLPNKNINAKECLELLTTFRPDLIVCISPNQIFKKSLLSLPTYGCLNLHSALLPKYRGLMPTFWALRNNEKEIGVSVFTMDEGIDTGKIILQKKISVGPNDSLKSMIDKNKRLGMGTIIEAISLIQAGNYKTVNFSPEEGSYYSFPTKKDIEEYISAGKKLL